MQNKSDFSAELAHIKKIFRDYHYFNAEFFTAMWRMASGTLALPSDEDFDKDAAEAFESLKETAESIAKADWAEAVKDGAGAGLSEMYEIPADTERWIPPSIAGLKKRFNIPDSETAPVTAEAEKMREIAADVSARLMSLESDFAGLKKTAEYIYSNFDTYIGVALERSTILRFINSLFYGSFTEKFEAESQKFYGQIADLLTKAEAVIEDAFEKIEGIINSRVLPNLEEFCACALNRGATIEDIKEEFFVPKLSDENSAQQGETVEDILKNPFSHLICAGAFAALSKKNKIDGESFSEIVEYTRRFGILLKPDGSLDEEKFEELAREFEAQGGAQADAQQN